MKNTLLICLTVLVLLGRAQAQVPNLINYQGRISVGTTNFTGTGQFRFALTNSDGSTFYWTNDGTGSPSAPPTNYVSVTVTKGLYSVLLGDTSLPNMTAIPTSVWTNPDVRLRVFFSDGTNSSQQLTPDQRLAPTGYLASGLTLAGPSTITLSSAADTLGTTSVDTLLGLRLMNSSGAGTFSSPNVTGIGFGQTSTRQAIVGETFGNDGLDFYVSGNLTTPKVRIDANGRLGVGTLSPLNTLDVTGFAHTTSGYKTDGTLYVAGTSTLVGNVSLNGVISGNGSGLTGITSTGLASNLTLAGITTLSGDLNLPFTTSGSIGVLDVGGSPFLHAYGPNGLADGNTFAGSSAGNFTLTGVANTATGNSALRANTTGQNNTVNGYAALIKNTAGSDNTVSGAYAFQSNTTSGQNVVVGSNALAGQNYGNGGTSWNSNNVAVGYSALNSNRSTATSNGIDNTAIGTFTLLNNTTGSNNIALGFQAGSNLTTGSNNIDIGSQGVAGESNVIRLGDGSTQTDTYLTGTVHASIATLSGTSTSTNALTAGSTTSGINLNGRTGIGSVPANNFALYVQRFGPSESAASFIAESGLTFLQIGTPNGITLYVNRATGLIARSDSSSSWDTPSDERIKHDIKPMTGALATLERLRPVRFHYNADFLAKSGGTPDYERFGVVAQEFQKVFPDFVDTNKDGMLSVRMDPIPIVTAAAVQEIDAQDKVRDATLANLQAENAALKKQMAQMQADDKDRDPDASRRQRS